MDPKYARRLTFGSLMFFGLIGGLLAEGYYSAASTDPAFNGIILAVVVLLVSIFSLLEFRKLAAGRGIAVFVGSLIAPLIFLHILPFHGTNPYEQISLALAFMLAFLLTALRQASKLGTTGAIANISTSLFALVYIALGGYFLISLRRMDAYSSTLAGQSGYLITFLATVKGTDIGAYLIGRKLGKHKIVPSISPGKSWEGLVGGFLFSTVIAVALGHYCFGLISVDNAVVFGLILTVYGQLGDLIESMFKRDAGLKDSASLIPEFGGFLDLIDSPYFAAPLGWVLFTGMKYGWKSLIL